MKLSIFLCLLVALPVMLRAAETQSASESEIKAYCLDFNWGGRRQFAKPGSWKNADPAEHVKWYKTIGANVIQTFCVSTNGYAWYKNGVVPEQPGLKHDFLPEVVKLGHAEGMKVFGYFCIASNTRWGKEHPELSYGTPSTYHIPYTDEYLEYLESAIGDAVSKTGIDGFMIDWVWQPRRQSTKGKWIDAEKKLYEQLMGEPFPGEDKLTKEQDLAYSRKAIDRCWKTIRKAAKDANPNCIIWLTTNHMNHPHAVNSDMYKQADWLMNESGDLRRIEQVRSMVGEHTRLITCLALWNGQEATEIVPAALEAGVGLYGFAKPRNGAGLIPLDKILTRQLSELSGDDRNIAVLARAYHGKSIDSIWVDGKFVEPDSPPPFRITLKRRGRGWQDTAKLEHGEGQSTVTIRNPYLRGAGQLTRVTDDWPKTLTIQLLKKNGNGAKTFKLANGQIALIASLDGSGKIESGKLEVDLTKRGRVNYDEMDTASKAPVANLAITETDEFIAITIPAAMLASNPPVLAFEWASK